MSLIEALDAAADKNEARLRLRGLLRRLVSSIWILVVPLSATRRVAALQMFFESGSRRDYLVFCQSAGYCRKAHTWARSLTEVTDPKELDLRNQDHALALAEELAELDLAEVEREE